MEHSRITSKGDITMVVHTMENKSRDVDKSTQTVTYHVSRASQTLLRHVIQTTQTILNRVCITVNKDKHAIVELGISLETKWLVMTGRETESLMPDLNTPGSGNSYVQWHEDVDIVDKYNAMPRLSIPGKHMVKAQKIDGIRDGTVNGLLVKQRTTHARIQHALVK